MNLTQLVQVDLPFSDERLFIVPNHWDPTCFHLLEPGGRTWLVDEQPRYFESPESATRWAQSRGKTPTATLRNSFNVPRPFQNLERGHHHQ